MGKTILAAFKVSGKGVWSLPWFEHGLIIEEQLGKT